MTDSTRNTLHWIVLVIALFLTVINLYDLIKGESSLSIWIGMVCWPIVAGCSIYQIVTGKRAGFRGN